MKAKYPTYEFQQELAKTPAESYANIMTRLGYEQVGSRLYYNKEKDRWGKCWVRWGSYGKQLEDGIFFGTGYKKDAEGELWFDYDEELPE